MDEDNNFQTLQNRDAGRSIIGRHIFIYSCDAQLIFFEIEIKILKSIVFTVCAQQYVPPAQLSIFRRPIPASEQQKMGGEGI